MYLDVISFQEVMNKFSYPHCHLQLIRFLSRQLMREPLNQSIMLTNRQSLSFL